MSSLTMLVSKKMPVPLAKDHAMLVWLTEHFKEECVVTGKVKEGMF